MAWERKQQQKTERQVLKEGLESLRREWKRLKWELEIYRRDREEHGWQKTDFERIREAWVRARMKAIEKMARDIKSQLAAMGEDTEEEKTLQQILDEETKRILAEEKARGLLD
jgi:hypothetical protein